MQAGRDKKDGRREGPELVGVVRGIGDRENTTIGRVCVGVWDLIRGRGSRN